MFGRAGLVILNSFPRIIPGRNGGSYRNPYENGRKNKRKNDVGTLEEIL